MNLKKIALFVAVSAVGLMPGKCFATNNDETASAGSLMDKGKFAEAAELYHQAINKNSNDVQAHVGLGTALTKQFKLDGADEQFDKALSLDPKNALAHAGKAMVLLDRLQSSSQSIIRNRESILQQADDQATQAVDEGTKSPEAHYSLGLVYREQGRFDEASLELNQAIKLDPKFSDAYSALGMVDIGRSDISSAQRDLNQAIALNSGNSSAHYGLARVYLKQDRIDDAIKELNTALYQNPISAPVHQALGAAYELQGNNAAALNEYQEAIRVKPESIQPYVRIAEIRQNRGDLEHSIAELRSALELVPDSPELHLWSANQSLQAGKADDAINEYQIVLKLDPGEGKAAQGLVRAYYVKAQKQAGGTLIGSPDVELTSIELKQLSQQHPDDMELRLAQAKFDVLLGKPFDTGNIKTPETDSQRIAFAEALLADRKFKESGLQMNVVIAHANTARQAFAVGDLAFMIRDLNSAELAYKKAATMGGEEERSKRGLAQVTAGRSEAKQSLNLADDLAGQKQTASAIDKYHQAIFADPRSTQARIGLAKSLDCHRASAVQLKQAADQYRAFLELKTDLPAKERAKLLKRADNLDARAVKLAGR